MINIWYTIKTKEVGNKVAAEVVRNWTHPRSHGSVPVWAGFFTTEAKAKHEAEYAAMKFASWQNECGAKH